MSQGTSDAAEIINEYSELITNAYCVLAVSVFVFWEYAITFSDEVEMFWKRRFSGASALFFVNRYVVLSVNILNLIGYATLPDRSCSLLARAAFAVTCLQYVVWAAFSGLRAFALSKSYTVALVVILLSSVSFGVDFSDFHFDLDGVNIPLLGCTATTAIPNALFQKYVIIVRTCLIAADIILIYVTWSTVGRNGFRNSRRSFVGVLLRDGTIYFVVLVILNVLHLVFTMLAVSTPSLNATLWPALTIPIHWRSSFTEPVTATLVSRFLIHLQAANRHVVHIDTHSSIGGGDHGDAGLITFSSLGTLVFERVVESMGSTLSYSHAEEVGSDSGGDDLNDRDTESTELRLVEGNSAPDAESGLVKDPEPVCHVI